VVSSVLRAAGRREAGAPPAEAWLSTEEMARVCGIAGLWVRGGARLDALEAATERMASVLEHRGPDGRRCWIDPSVGVGLGHTRLSIIDLSETGDQPMVDHSGSTLIAFNGEIYNYLELRATLESDGVKFRGTSDTEVLLALYAKLGLECVAQLRGMFAFAIWDGAERRLVLARDRVGKKPLYYWAPDARTLCFGSEIKAVRAATRPIRVDSAALNTICDSLVGERGRSTGESGKSRPGTRSSLRRHRRRASCSTGSRSGHRKNRCRSTRRSSGRGSCSGNR
jgi:asparagine synthase (glutamine-hydrolysing)